MLINPTILSLIAIATSVGVFVIGMLSYKRNRRLDNENHLYKMKIDKYHEVLRQISSILKEVDTALDLAHTCKFEESDKVEEELEDIALKLDEQIHEFNLFTSSNSLLFPSRIIEIMEALVDELMEVNIEFEDLEEGEKITDKCYKLSEDIQVAMRKDLNIETLNIALFKRIKK
jgi:hypothetical protein